MGAGKAALAVFLMIALVFMPMREGCEVSFQEGQMH